MPSRAARTLLCLLTENGPQARPALRALLSGAGVEMTAAGVDELLDGPDAEDELSLVVELSDGRMAAQDALLAGRILTHRLTADEIDNDVLTIEPDLVSMTGLTDDDRYTRLADGGRFIEVWEGPGVDDNGSFSLAEGALRGYRDGDLIGLRIRAEGLLLERVPAAAPSPTDLQARLHAALRDEAGDTTPVLLDLVIWQLCADDPDLFTEPLAPVTELLAATGLSRFGDYIAPEGFDITGWRIGQAARSISEIYRLSDEDGFAVAVLAEFAAQVNASLDTDDGGDGDTDIEGIDGIEGIDKWLDDEPPGTTSQGSPGADDESPREVLVLLPALLESLADPAAAEALLEEALGDSIENAVGLGALAESWEPKAPRRARSGIRWIRAKCLQRLGQVAEAEVELQAALDLDPLSPLALAEMARFASDRGDAARALSLLRRSGASPDDEVVQLLSGLVAPERPGLGRNARCWCGSGRKYKQCHLGKEEVPLNDRAGWLYHKATTFLADGPYRAMLMSLALTRARHWHDDDALRRAMADPLVPDAALFEGGAFQDFLAQRGPLLPADEQLLAAQWLTVERSVFEIEQVQRGHGFTVRDMRTGDRQEVDEKSGSRSLRVGDRFVARIVPLGERRQIFGGIEPLPLWQQQDAIALLDSVHAGDADAEDLVGFLTARFAPPRMTTTDGEPMVICTAALTSRNGVDALRAELDQTYEPDGDDAWVASEPNGPNTRVLARLTLDGTTLQVEAMNERRFDALLRALRSAVPTLDLLSETRKPAAEAMRDAAARTSSRTTDPNPDADLRSDPAVAAALEQMTLDYEKAWLDMDIPALGGLTPRQAADDPTRRGDLVHLLRTFDGGADRPGSMRPARIRAALGL